jgi:hypothetical protein
MQFLTLLTKGRVVEEIDQKEKEGLAYYECVPRLYSVYAEAFPLI